MLKSTLALILSFVVLTGCTSHGSDLETPLGWEEPGWMAQVRQQDEAYQNAMISCYSEYGLKGIKQMGGSVMFENLADENGDIPPAVQELVDASAEDCNARVRLPEHKENATLDDTSYTRMLEVRECIVARGYDVPQPPSAETWKDADPWYSAWNPYAATFDGPAGASLSDSEAEALSQACPQSGPTYWVGIVSSSNG